MSSENIYYDVEVIDHHELRIRRGPGKRELGWDDEFVSCEGEAGLRDHLSDCGYEGDVIDDVLKQSNEAAEGQWAEIRA